MKIKTFLSALCVLVMAFGVIPNVSAQVSNASCTPFNYSLGFGMRGGEVARLQTVLISQGYLGNGLATGYYGSMTLVAVKRFQATNGVPATGFAGSLTRAALYNFTCGNNPIPPNTTGVPTITSVAPGYGAFGTTVTLYGTNFSRTTGNSINFGNVQNIRTGVISQNGTSLQFTIPVSPCPEGQYVCTAIAFAPGNYGISVSNGFGTSNSINFQVIDIYNPNPNPTNPTSPTITSISPSYGPVGSTVTIYGSNFSRNGSNSINFAGMQNVRTGVVSNDGTSMQFVIPGTPCAQGQTCSQVELNPGTYGITVSNGYGTSNSQSFQITDTSANPNNPNPVINSVDGPSSLAVGQQGTWTVRGSNSGGGNLTYTVSWGDEVNQSGATAINDTFLQSTTFTHAYQNPGVYTARFSVINNTGREVTSSITVNVAGNTTANAPTLISLNPTVGRFGNPVTITGTNFNRYDNIVNFGNIQRAAMHIPSYDGKTLQFTPTGSTCPADAYACTLMMLGDGDYAVSVTTDRGTSNALTYKISTNGTSSNSQNPVLKVGQTVEVGSVLVTVEGITDDSRCPSNVTCIQAGRVLVLTTIRSTYGFRTINMSSEGNIFTAEDGYKVQIVGVEPTRSSTAAIAASDYKITYKIWK